MAKKGGSNVLPAKTGFMGGVTWVNVNLSGDDVAAISEWLSQEPDIFPEVLRLVANGFAFSVKPSSNGDGYMATLIEATAGDGNQGRGLSAYADTPFNACGVLLYKFVTLLDGTFADSSGTGNSKFR